MVTGFSIGIKENSQDTSRNRTNVTVSLTISWNGGSYNATGNAAGTLTVDDTEYPFTAKFNTEQKSSGSQVIFSKTLDIVHDADGSKTLACSAYFVTGTQVGTVRATASKALTAIPGESTIGATDANIGAVSVISVNRKNAEYTHSIAYAFGQLTGYLTDGAGALGEQEVKLGAVSLAFPIPERFYDQIPNGKTGSCTLTIKTYSGDTQIGSGRSCTFTVTAAEEKCRPEVGGTVEDVNEMTIALTGDKNKLVRGMSTALCRITAQAKNGATLEKKTIGAVEVTENQYTISGVETGSIVFSATDSRGYTGTYEAETQMIEYVKPTLSGAISRTDPTSGNCLLTLQGKCFRGSFGSRENTLRVCYRTEGDEYIEIEPQIVGNEYSVSTHISGLDYQRSHTVTVTVEDCLMSVSKELTVGKGIPVFDWGEQDFSFHVPVSVMGVPLKNVVTTLQDPDSFTFNDTDLHMGYGLINDEGYISINIGWTVFQLKVVPGNRIFARAKYGSNEWGQWKLLTQE